MPVFKTTHAICLCTCNIQSGKVHLHLRTFIHGKGCPFRHGVPGAGVYDQVNITVRLLEPGHLEES